MINLPQSAFHVKHRGNAVVETVRTASFVRLTNTKNAVSDERITAFHVKHLPTSTLILLKPGLSDGPRR